MEKNKTGKYLKYAIGEIILVVIGILIALQINNWNNENIQREKEVVYLTEIKSNLSFDLNNEIIPAINLLEENISRNSILLSGFSKKDLTLSPDTIKHYFNEIYFKDWKIQLNSSGYENLNSVGIDLIFSDSIRSNISMLYNYHHPIINKFQNKTDTFWMQEMQTILMDEVLFKLYSTKNITENLKEIKANEKLKIRMSRSRDYTYNRLIWLRIIRLESEKLIKAIDTYIISTS